MNHLVYCLNATIPVFLLMLLGVFFRKIGLMDDSFASKLNHFVFQVALPVLVFQDMAQSDFFAVWDGKFVMFCFLATAASILISTALSFLVAQPDCRGEFVQASYRSSAALLGVALMENLYGSAGAAPLMMIGAVPLYNVAAVTVLNLMRPEQNHDRSLIKKTLIGVISNPILIGIFLGCLWSVLKLPQPAIFSKTVSSLASVATPLGLLSMGASFRLKSAAGQLKPAFICSACKLVVFTAIFLPIAIALGFRQDKLVAILVMLGAATTVSCYVMAKNLGYEGALTTNTVMLTTFLAAFTLTAWLFLVRSLGLI